MSCEGVALAGVRREQIPQLPVFILQSLQLLHVTAKPPYLAIQS
jgi:hypothetical protein